MSPAVAFFLQATVVASLVWSLFIFSGGLLTLIPDEGGSFWAGDLRDIAAWWRRRRGGGKGGTAAGSDCTCEEEQGGPPFDPEAGHGPAGHGPAGGSGGGVDERGDESGGGDGRDEAAVAAPPACEGAPNRQLRADRPTAPSWP